MDHLLSNASASVLSVSDGFSTLSQQVSNTSWPDNVTAEAKLLQSDLSAAANELGLLSSSIDDFDPTAANKDISHYESLREAYTVTFTTSVCVILVASSLVACLRSRPLSILFVWLLHLVASLCFLLAAAEFPLSVAIADLCVHPDEFVIDTLDSPSAAFFVQCSPDAVSPFARDYNDAQDFLSASAQLLTNIAEQGNVSTAELMQSLQASNNSLRALAPYLECARPQQLYFQALTELCDTVLPGVFGMLLSHCVAGAMSLAAALMLAAMVQAMTTNVGFYLDEEGQGLLARSPSTRTTTSFL
eukprot:TRINITY_DN12144_c0_g1_i11.p1 TRINITY_DN12144_c0_g1~~TRINITY_DN12144_c0_g1_i11.p1  ORF type:complete len:323 (+),score=71.44 TRINITY_DN12144_c0_g1_i11:62-970(+)